jgi:NodT family efflux transporter outer membrane factor (OMF) lipoprotein
VDYQGFQLEGAYVALTANIVTAAIREAALRAEIKATEEILAARRKELAIVERQYKLGGAARSDVLTQRAELAQIETGLLPLEKELAATRHRLSVLVGRFPGEAGMPEFRIEDMTLPADLPVSVPSALVRQRPDIRAAEALLHQASAQVGVATANLYPRITLTGSYGSLANSAGDLFGSGSTVWSLGGSLVQPLFHRGELGARRRAAIAAYDQAAAQYRDTVLRAFQNVADTLRALDIDARLLASQARAEAAARDALALTRRSYELGGTNFLSLLNAQRQHQQARVGLVQAQASRYADTAALFQALGGGWWDRPAPLEAVPANEKGIQE